MDKLHKEKALILYLFSVDMSPSTTKSKFE